MRKVCSFIALLLVFSACSHKVEDYADFCQQQFAEPDNTFRTVPFYSLNDNLTAEEMDRQL